MGELNLTSRAVSALASIEGKLPQEVQAMQWLVPLESLDQEEEYRDQLMVTNRAYRKLQMALDDCNAHIMQVLFSIYPDRLNFANMLNIM
jgi:hypothetical protein